MTNLTSIGTKYLFLGACSWQVQAGPGSHIGTWQQTMARQHSGERAREEIRKKLKVQKPKDLMYYHETQKRLRLSNHKPRKNVPVSY
jgi:hypothetical protein